MWMLNQCCWFHSSRLYYTKVGLGSPAKEFYVQVDTGSDILWVNCVGCTACSKQLNFFNIHAFWLKYKNIESCSFNYHVADGFNPL